MTVRRAMHAIELLLLRTGRDVRRETTGVLAVVSAVQLGHAGGKDSSDRLAGPGRIRTGPVVMAWWCRSGTNTAPTWTIP